VVRDLELAVVTPSFGPDADLFAELHRSVLEHTGVHTVHHVIVPRDDRDLFARFEGSRCRVWTEPEVLPSRFHLVRPGWWVNARRPWPPVRGWVLQQVLKIAAAAALDADVVLIADSDVVLVRPVEPARFVRDGRLSVYRVDDAVHAGMTDHVQWHGVARRMLGVPGVARPPLPDYVSSLNVWSPQVVRDMQRRITAVTGRDWVDAVAGRLRVSEFILYGVFVDEVLAAGAGRAVADTTFCLDYWDRTPLDDAGADALAARLGPDAVGIMISAKSRTPLPVRRRAVARCAEIVARTR
jgi:hypothetical protein